MTTITSLKNPRVKNAVRLREGRQRRKQQRIVIDGGRELLRAVEAGTPILEVFICDPLCDTSLSERVLSLLADTNAEIFRVDEMVFEKLAFGARSEGLLGVAVTPETPLSRLSTSGNPLLGVMEQIEKPGNVGAVLRSADGAGVSGLIAADPRTDLFNPNAIRASLGTVFSMPIATATSEETIAWLREQKITIYAARVDGSVPYTEVDLTGPSALVLGSEAHGLSDGWRADDIQAIRLPMLGTADSLNISVAAAVLFYEALRQRSASHDA